MKVVRRQTTPIPDLATSKLVACDLRPPSRSSLGRRAGAHLRCAAAVLALCGAIASCHPALQAGNGVPAGRLVIAVPQEPQSLNTLLTEGPSSTMLDPLVYSFLLTIDDRGNLAPDLAAEVPSARNGGISADGRTITYRLLRPIRTQYGYD